MHYTDLRIHKFDIQILSWQDHEGNPQHIHWRSLLRDTNLEKKQTQVIIW